jgi:pyruvate dehydrogenase (quinone)
LIRPIEHRAQALDRSRQVIALCADGGLNMLMCDFMLMCEFLTAAHHKLSVKAVIFGISASGLIIFEAESVGLPPFRKGIEFPTPDFAPSPVPAAVTDLQPESRMN